MTTDTKTTVNSLKHSLFQPFIFYIKRDNNIRDQNNIKSDFTGSYCFMYKLPFMVGVWIISIAYGSNRNHGQPKLFWIRYFMASRKPYN